MSSHSTSDLNHPANHVFVDYENVHHVDLSLMGSRSVQLTLLLGARQTKLDAALVEKLIEHTASVQLIRLSSSGKNALDFALAYYLGRAANDNPNAHFHIVSKDTGFDPLIAHLRSRDIHVHRHTDYSSLTFAGPRKTSTAEPTDLMKRVVAHLRKNTSNRPRRKRTLVSHLVAFCGKSADENGVNELIEKLSKAGHLSIGDKEAVTYHLDSK